MKSDDLDALISFPKHPVIATNDNWRPDPPPPDDGEPEFEPALLAA